MMTITSYDENAAAGDAAGLAPIHDRLVAADIAHDLEIGEHSPACLVITLNGGARVRIGRTEDWETGRLSNTHWSLWRMEADNDTFTDLGSRWTLDEVVTRIHLQISPVDFRAVTDLELGDVRVGGGIITHIRTSKSGKTAWITDTTGLVEKISTAAKIAIAR